MRSKVYKDLKRVIVCILVMSILFASKGFFIFTGSFKIYANENEAGAKIGSSSIIIDELLEEEGKTDYPLLGWTGGSNVNGDNLVVSSEFEYAYLLYSGKEDKSRFYYSDDYFKNPSTVYNNHLSTMSIDLAISGVGNYIDEEKDKYANAKDVLSKAGFVNITPNDDFLRHPEENTMGSVCANKHIYLKDSDGNVKDYNLFTIVMRSANYNYEWASNFKLGESGDHQGFSESRDKVYDHFNTFYNEHKNDFGDIPVKIWVVGYSRGAGVANLLGGKLTDECTSFNTTKENIYCYTLGTPQAALISAHTSPTLDSYTNIHNVVTDADFIQLFAPSTLGFSRYGVDHKLPVYVSDKVHDDAERTAKEQSNAEYMPKYNEMVSQLNKIDPTMFNQLNNLEMFELTVFDASKFQYLIYNRLGDEPFSDTSDEREYYQAIEYVKALIEGTMMDLLNCNYAGTDYGTITGRDRYYQKYQGIIGRLIRIAVGSDTDAIMEKVKQNAMDNLLKILPLVIIFDKLIYCEGDPPDRSHFDIGGGTYWNVYDELQPIYEILLNGAVEPDDYTFLTTNHRDLTDFALDLLNVDFRSTRLPKKSSIGTLVRNFSLIAAEHLASVYVAWLQREDDYFTTAPSNTLNYDGIKTLTFTDLRDSKVEVFNENNDKICEYIIDASNNVTCNDIIGTEYAHIVKSYNPEGMELRLASDKNYKAVVTANDKSLGQVIYREYFVSDAEYYRKEMPLGEIYLKSYENIEVSFHESSYEKVLSCYPSEYLKDYKAAMFEKVYDRGMDLSYGYDNYSCASEPSIYKTVKLSAESLKGGAAGDYASFSGTSFENQNSVLESADLDSGDVYKKIDLLSKADAVLHVVNNVNDGYEGIRTYNNFSDSVKTETNMTYNKANIYYMGRNAEHSVLHTLEVNAGLTGLMGEAIDIATSSDVNEKENEADGDAAHIVRGDEAHKVRGDDEGSSGDEIGASSASPEDKESEDGDEAHKVRGDDEGSSGDEVGASSASPEDKESEDGDDVAHTVRGDEAHKVRGDDEGSSGDEVGASSASPEVEELESGDDAARAVRGDDEEPVEGDDAAAHIVRGYDEETSIVENTVGGFTNTEIEELQIASESEVETIISDDNELFGTTNRLYYVSVPYGYAKDSSGVEKKYFNEGDTAKIFITKEDTGKKIKSISIYNGEELVETIDNVELNVAVDYTVSNFDIRVVANFENKKYPVNFTTQAEGTFYYFDGKSFVEGVSGNEYEYGTKIRFTAPMMYDGREFFGWTLKDDADRYLNQKGVDTPKIANESTSTNSTYTLELKDYGIDILANYRYKAYLLTLQIDGSKGEASPSDAVLEFTSLESFNNAKYNIDVVSIGPKAFLGWSDGKFKYEKLSDYTWQFKTDINLVAVFESDIPPGGGGGDSGDSGGSSSGGGGGGTGAGPRDVAPQVTEINTTSDSTNIVVDTSYSTWVYDPVSNKFKLDININGLDIYATNGFYTINSIQTTIINEETKETVVSNTYCFDSNGNMVTGWVNTADNKWYFFENAKTKDEGIMVTGWKEVQGSWYFFAANGVMLTSTFTPDGYLVGADGKWITA